MLGDRHTMFLSNGPKTCIVRMARRFARPGEGMEGETFGADTQGTFSLSRGEFRIGQRDRGDGDQSTVGVAAEIHDPVSGRTVTTAGNMEKTSALVVRQCVQI